MHKRLAKLEKSIIKNLSKPRLVEYLYMEEVAEFKAKFLYDRYTTALKITSTSQFMRGVELYVVAYTKKQYRVHTSSGYGTVKPLNQILIELAIQLESERIKNIYKEV